MKYKVKVVGFEVNNTKKVCLLFKGAFFCRLNNGISFFNLPWNVKVINLSNENLFPIILKGFRGKLMINLSDVEFDHGVWSTPKELHSRSQHKLKQYKYSDFQKLFKVEEIVKRIHFEYIDPEPVFNNILKTKVNQPKIDLSELTKFELPKTIIK